MTPQNSTILITGGTSGLGYEMAKQYLAFGHTVIVCSRTLTKLEETKLSLPNVVTYQCDISSKDQRIQLQTWLAQNYPKLSIVINNAAIVHKTNFIDDRESYLKLMTELQTNLIAPIDLIHLLYPIISQNKNPKIINITTGLIYAPRIIYPFYNATKAALHSFTQILRSQLKDENIKIIEVMFPVVNTPWHNGNPPKMAISPQKAVSEMIFKINRNQSEIRIGKVKLLYILARIAPKFTFRKINAIK